MIHRTGLRYHKLKHYVDRPAEITGVVVRDGKVVVPNRQRLKHRKTRLALQQPGSGDQRLKGRLSGLAGQMRQIDSMRSEEHTSELQSLMRISYAVFCLKKKSTHNNRTDI